ncbi:MAG: toprim domain-containing protein [Candidatus Bathyarchaeota archaeon]
MVRRSGNERKLELLTRLFQKLRLRGGKGIPILVEGKKDMAALRKLGINGTIICIKNSTTILADLLDDVKSEEITLLVDFDDTGVSLAKNIQQYLEGRGVKVDSIFWREARALVRRDIKDIEGIPSYLEKLKKSASHS